MKATLWQPRSRATRAIFSGLAERLGPVRFHELLNEFFRDVADAALECEAEIHKYVGDEAILTWLDTDSLADGECLACPFLVRDIMMAKAETYRTRFGALPEFRASLHRGPIVAGESCSPQDWRRSRWLGGPPAIHRLFRNGAGLAEP